jgi:hypothetical protein
MGGRVLESQPERIVQHFRQILLWPLQLMPIREDAQIQTHWALLQSASTDNPWHEIVDEFTDDPSGFQERHYGEFVTFLPYVQRMLYGEGKGRGAAAGESPIRVFRRDDVRKLRLTYPRDSEGPVEFEVAHVDLYFFYDLDIVILAVEILAMDIEFARAHETLYRFGRAYPTHWEDDGHGGHCCAKVEWLGESDAVLATSDYERREKYLSYVCRFRAPCISSHWEFLLRPLVLHHSMEPGPIRYRLLEYHRMPVLGYFALEDPRQLTRADFVRLAFVTAPGPSDELPFSEHHLRNFEYRYCLDRFWRARSDGPLGTRMLCSGEAFMVVGSAEDPYFMDADYGLREQFRHQYFLVFLIAHMHKAALLMLSDRLVNTLNQLDISDPESVKRFKRHIRQLKEIFLRFTHRYWFHEVSDQAQAKDLYHMCQEHLGTERLYAEVKDEVEGMNAYLDSDALRRQANTVVRLTVVTIFGLIGTVTTGYFGMNLLDETAEPLWYRVALFFGIIIPVILLTFYTMMKSKRLSDFLDALSDERLSLSAKLGALLDVWRKPSRRGARSRR